MFLDKIQNQLMASVPVYQMMAPGPSMALKPGIVKAVLLGVQSVPAVINFISNRDSTPEMIGQSLGATIVAATLSLLTNNVFSKVLVKTSTTKRSWFKRKNGFGGRNWPDEITEMDYDTRMIRQMVVVFHDADKAGRHLDIHIGQTSLIVRVSGKPVESSIKYNSSGALTTASKEALVAHLRQEVANGSRMAQNLDHSLANARTVWFKGEPGLKGYGAGATRQIVFEEPVEFIKINKSGAIRMYCPKIWPHGQTFLHKLYPGKGSNPVPIVVWGITNPEIPKFEDRLHLKKVDAKDIDKFRSLVDTKTVTRKYDAASAHFNSNDKGTTFWSPRISVKTGGRIEYTHKVPELSRITCGGNMNGMGELLFREKFNIFNTDHWFDRDRYLSSASVGGILNADRIRPRNVIPDFRVYRIDRFNGKSVIGLDFFANRNIAAIFAAKSKFVNLPEFADIKRIDGWEGLVGFSEKDGVVNGFKIKWSEDPKDWKITSVDLVTGPKGRIAGVVWFKSLDSGKLFKMGASQLGNDEFVKQIMDNPENFVGSVFKVQSQIGHEGRAAGIERHMDK